MEAQIIRKNEFVVLSMDKRAIKVWDSVTLFVIIAVVLFCNPRTETFLERKSILSPSKGDHTINLDDVSFFCNIEKRNENSCLDENLS